MPQTALAVDPPDRQALVDAPLNQIYGYRMLPGSGIDVPPYDGGVHRVERAIGAIPPGLTLFASPPAHVQAGVSAAHDAAAYIWGCPAHSRIPRAELPEWCAAAVACQQYTRFQDLLGTFVILVDEPRRRRFTIVTDPLGIRPLFTSRTPDRFVFGSDVWTLRHAGLIRPAIDYDAVSAWIAYGFNCTAGSLFEDVRRVPPGVAMIVEDDRSATVPYATFVMDARPLTTEQAADDIHAIVSSDVRTLLRDVPRVVVPLSGGFDSRYLLALSSRSTVLERVVSVAFSPAEGAVAREVADALELPLETIPVSGSVWDLYDDVHHFQADGFPVSKFVTYSVSERYPAVPVVNGFLGDSLIRGSNDRLDGTGEEAWGNDVAGALQRKHLAVSLNLFRPDVVSRVLDRARTPMTEAARSGGTRAFAWADLYLRQRHYISNNFLQHLDISESLLPFYSWRLMSHKMMHARDAFTPETYQRIFDRYLPGLAAIPPASRLAARAPQPPLAQCTVRWARDLIAPLLAGDRLRPLSRPLCLSLVTIGASRLTSLSRRVSDIVEDAVFTCRRLHLLERRLRGASLTFDWDDL